MIGTKIGFMVSAGLSVALAFGSGVNAVKTYSTEAVGVSMHGTITCKGRAPAEFAIGNIGGGK